jgi:hypothetical protein
MDANELIAADEEMQRLAFNLADALDTLNVHSMDEAVDDLRIAVFPICENLRGEIRRMSRAMDKVRLAFPAADAVALDKELGAMDALLDMLHKCTGEVRNYKDFIGGLIPLLRRCEAWGEAGPLRESGGY